LANDSDFGLEVLYSHKILNAEKIADQIDSGMLFINHLLGHKQIFLLAEQNNQALVELSELGIHEFVNKTNSGK
jgi:acyl-CoA reductase-like NAD-dependent aldehyde dehydrogenase